MKTKIYVITLFILTSCNILKKEKLTLKKLSQKEEFQIASQRNTLSQQSQLLLIDSSHNDFMMMLWPKGKFTFSVAKGFEGEAEKMMIKGKHTSQKMINLKQEMEKDSTAFNTYYSNEKESSTMVKKNKLRFGYSWTWLLIIPVIYILYKCYKQVLLLHR